MEMNELRARTRAAKQLK